MQKKKRIYLLPLCFFLIIAALTVAFFALPKQQFAENEKRVLAEPPQFSFAALLDGSLTEQAQTYIADHFPLREAFVGLNAYAEQLFGRNGDSGVYRGKNGFLFTAQGEISLEKTADNVQKIRDFAARNGLETTWMLVPCSGFVLDEMLPRFHKTFRDGEILAAAKEAAGTDAFLDVPGAFEGLDKTQLYYRTDHHLTSLGSLALYETFCAAKGLTPQQFTRTQTSGGFYGTGMEIAERIYERHRLLTDFFIGLGADPETAADDACRCRKRKGRMGCQQRQSGHSRGTLFADIQVG